MQPDLANAGRQVRLTGACKIPLPGYSRPGRPVTPAAARVEPAAARDRTNWARCGILRPHTRGPVRGRVTSGGPGPKYSGRRAAVPADRCVFLSQV